MPRLRVAHERGNGCAGRAIAGPLAALLVAVLAPSCQSVRTGPESSSATNRAERIAELEHRVLRDRERLERFVSSTETPDEAALREIAWRLPENQRELRELLASTTANENGEGVGADGGAAAPADASEPDANFDADLDASDDGDPRRDAATP